MSWWTIFWWLTKAAAGLYLALCLARAVQMHFALKRQIKAAGAQFAEKKKRARSDIQGPQRREAPADVIGNAVHVMQIATGEIDGTATTEDGKNAAAVALGPMGGKARAKRLSARKRKETN